MWRPNFSMGDLIALLAVIGTLLAVVGQAWINQAVGDEVQVQLEKTDNSLDKIQKKQDMHEIRLQDLQITVEVLRESNAAQDQQLDEISERLDFLITCEISGCSVKQR